MLSAKRKLKNAALLWNRTQLTPIIHNKTRWSGKYKMLKGWITIRDDLIEVSKNPESDDIQVNTSATFRLHVQKYTTQMGEINYVTLFMQKRCWSLSSCRTALDVPLSMTSIKVTKSKATSGMAASSRV